MRAATNNDAGSRVSAPVNSRAIYAASRISQLRKSSSATSQLINKAASIQASLGRQDSTSRGNRPSEHRAGIAVASDGDDLSVHDLDVLGERNDAEDGVDVHECDAMLAIDNEPDDVDALHDAGEVIESLPKPGRASISVRRKLAHGIRMKGESGGVVVAHSLDVLPTTCITCSRINLPLPQRRRNLPRLEVDKSATCSMSSQRDRRPSRVKSSHNHFDVRAMTGSLCELCRR